MWWSGDIQRKDTVKPVKGRVKTNCLNYTFTPHPSIVKRNGWICHMRRKLLWVAPPQLKLVPPSKPCSRPACQRCRTPPEHSQPQIPPQPLAVPFQKFQYTPAAARFQLQKPPSMDNQCLSYVFQAKTLPLPTPGLTPVQEWELDQYVTARVLQPRADPPIHILIHLTNPSPLHPEPLEEEQNRAISWLEPLDSPYPTQTENPDSSPTQAPAAMSHRPAESAQN
ncbi:uncharacterized protein G2W53_031037 [Senna tora]|uniref:Uncharacterized protein n=1 Tax=Senna tora TaxID=362788 RepID=A0A834WDJ3_9FABA|nr:uncharacterized protein G2W53_031037 [Senna tora]